MSTKWGREPCGWARISRAEAIATTKNEGISSDFFSVLSIRRRLLLSLWMAHYSDAETGQIQALIESR
jgi:hypothetical protein